MAIFLKKNYNKSFFFTIKIIFPSKFFLKNFLRKVKKNNKNKKIMFQFFRKKNKQFVFLKSPHVNKKAKEHFCISKYSLNLKTISSFKNLIGLLKIFPLFINFYIVSYNFNKFNKLKEKQKIFELLEKKCFEKDLL